MNQDELNEIIEQHELWLNNEGGERANLYGANLYGANLWSTTGNMCQIKSIFIDTWPIGYTKDVIQIGCKKYNIDEWWSFSDDEIAKMDDNALEWWNKYKDIIKGIIDSSPAE